MSEVRPLPPSRLRTLCDPAAFGFETTAELAEVAGIIGQERAEEAVRVAIGIRSYGYNLYALGTSASSAVVSKANAAGSQTVRRREGGSGRTSLIVAPPAPILS